MRTEKSAAVDGVNVLYGFVGVGSLMLLLSVAGYAYGMPVFDQNTGRDAGPTGRLFFFLFMGGSGALLAVTGMLLRWMGPNAHRVLVAVGWFFALQCLYGLFLFLFFDT